MRSYIVAVILVTLFAACGDMVEPTTGALRVTTASTHLEFPFAYSLKVDSEPPVGIFPNWEVVITRISTGSHAVALEDVPHGCRVDGDNPRKATVYAGVETSVYFSVACFETYPIPVRALADSNPRSGRVGR